jgi:hypothetical protein
MNRNQPVKKLVDHIWNNQQYGNSIQQNSSIVDILQENKLALFIIGMSYFYFLDMKDANINNFSSGTKDVLGYEPNEISLEKLIPLVHPIDLPVLYLLRRKSWHFSVNCQ